MKDIIAQLAQKFRSELIDFQDVIKKTAEIPSKESRAKKSVLLYSHASISSQGNIMELCSYVEKAYNYIDILVIAQNEDRVKSNSTQTFLNHLNRELLEQFWVKKLWKLIKSEIIFY